MDWNLIWAGLTASTGITLLIVGLFNFVRTNDMRSVESKITELEQRIVKSEFSSSIKLNEAEFRRFEDRYEKAIASLQEHTSEALEKLDTKLDEKFEKLFLMLNKTK